MLKFENVAKVNDRIRAFDFQPMPGREDRYIEGIVTSIVEEPFKGFEVMVTKDTLYPNGERCAVTVPMQIGFSDFDNRIVKL